MRSRVVIIIVALALGGLAAVMAARYLGAAQSRVESQSQPVEVLVAQMDIDRGTPVEEMFQKQMVALEEIPQQFVAAGAVSSQRSIEGQVLSVPVSSGEQLTTGRFQYPSQAGLAYSVPENYVAVSIPIDGVTGVSGLVKPGDNVALLATIEILEGDQPQVITKTLIPKARVLALGASTGVEQEVPDEESGALGGTTQSTDAAQTVTLALEPADAERVVFSVNEGAAGGPRSVWLVLLPAQGGGVIETSGQTAQTVLR